MFTGLVLTTAKVLSVRKAGRGISFSVDCEKIKGIEPGSSVAIDGVCLSVEKTSNNAIFFTAVEETVRRTTLKNLSPGKIVNVELPLRADSPLGGHIVLGHIDCVGYIRKITMQKFQRILTVEFPPKFGKFVVRKGSIAIDGISLTIANCGENWVSVAIIPQTIKQTSISLKRIGDGVNIEFDIIGKYIARLLKKQNLTEDTETEEEISSFF